MENLMSYPEYGVPKTTFAGIEQVAVSSSRLVRPVRCHFCNEPMFYAVEQRHVPEVRIEVHGPDEHSGHRA